EMRVPTLEQRVVGVAHRLRPGAAQHYLEVHRLQAGIDVTMNDARRAAYAFPWTQARGQALPAFILEENVQEALQHEEDLFHLVGVRGIALTRLYKHHREGEVARRYDRRIVVLARSAGTDEAVLGPIVALRLGILERCPIGRLIAKSSDMAGGDFL